jgi:drug/metabolite transporter (DMT)-like permease
MVTSDMMKLVFILVIGLVFESVGVVLLKKGLNAIGDVSSVSWAEMGRVLKLGATNPQILLGVFFEALFFACLLVLMARSDISFLWPLTALSFVFATLAAMIFLDERVSPLRWIGVVLIVLGAACITYSEQTKSKPAPADFQNPRNQAGSL